MKVFDKQSIFSYNLSNVILKFVTSYDGKE